MPPAASSESRTGALARGATPKAELDTGRAVLPAVLRVHPLATLIVAAVILRLALTPLYANLPGGLLDEGFWKHWMEIIEREGVLNIFRASDTDYVGYHWLLWALAAIYEVIGGPYTQTTP